MVSNVRLMDVMEDDLPIFFEQQLDPEANFMAAFTAPDPADRQAFAVHWSKILGDKTLSIQTVLADGQVAGHISSYPEQGRLEVTYWLGRAYWGRGIAAQALALFLEQVTQRPLYARVAEDNSASRRVLEKCGFIICGEDKGFANARGIEIPEYLLMLADTEQNSVDPAP